MGLGFAIDRLQLLLFPNALPHPSSLAIFAGIIVNSLSTLKPRNVPCRFIEERHCRHRGAMDQKQSDLLSRYERRGSRCALLVVLACLFAGGCTSTRKQVSQALGGNVHAPVTREETVEQSYRIGCPDIVEIAIDGAPGGGQYVVSAEGRIAFAPLGNPRIEGETSASLAQRISSELRLKPEQVHCKVVAHRGRVIFIHGPIEGGDRAVTYRGTESVVGLIRRCGGLTPAADFKDVHIVRSNVALGGIPQVFAVDLEAILLRGEPQTNVPVQPFDEIFIGETPRSKIGRALPDWLRPAYRGFCGLIPSLCPHDWRQQIRDVEP